MAESLHRELDGFEALDAGIKLKLGPMMKTRRFAPQVKSWVFSVLSALILATRWPD
jgi:hypothetical protein